MCRLDEIAARLETNRADHLSAAHALADFQAHAKDDIAFLLAEVKRLENYTLEQEHHNARECGGWIKRAQSAEALALSLAEALEEIAEPGHEEWWMREAATAALSSPALLKLRGKE